MIRIQPIDGWGFDETTDGKLASPFDAEVIEVEVHQGIRGWRGIALNGKYSGAVVDLTPRHSPFSGVVVLHVRTSADEAGYFFSGMAETEGLECSWL